MSFFFCISSIRCVGWDDVYFFYWNLYISDRMIDCLLRIYKKKTPETNFDDMCLYMCLI